MKKQAVIFDIDDTLIIEDTGELSLSVYSYWLKYSALDYALIVLTNRNEAMRERTIEELSFFRIFYTELIMRPKELDWKIEASWFKQRATAKIRQRYDVAAAFDDNTDNCRMFKKIGIKDVFKVNHSNIKKL